MARLEKSLTDYYATFSTNDSDVGRKDGNKADKNQIKTDKENKITTSNVKDKKKKINEKNNSIIKHDFQDKFTSLSEYLVTRLDSLHWSEVHKGKNLFLWNIYYYLLSVLFYSDQFSN